MCRVFYILKLTALSCSLVFRGRKVLETRGVNETSKIVSLEEELKEAQFISEDANRKLEEVGISAPHLLCAPLVFISPAASVCVFFPGMSLITFLEG